MKCVALIVILAFVGANAVEEEPDKMPVKRQLYVNSMPYAYGYGYRTLGVPVASAVRVVAPSAVKLVAPSTVKLMAPTIKLVSPATVKVITPSYVPFAAPLRYVAMNPYYELKAFVPKPMEVKVFEKIEEPIVMEEKKEVVEEELKIVEREVKEPKKEKKPEEEKKPEAKPEMEKKKE